MFLRCTPGAKRWSSRFLSASWSVRATLNCFDFPPGRTIRTSMNPSSSPRHSPSRRSLRDKSLKPRCRYTFERLAVSDTSSGLGGSRCASCSRSDGIGAGFNCLLGGRSSFKFAIGLLAGEMDSRGALGAEAGCPRAPLRPGCGALQPSIGAGVSPCGPDESASAPADGAAAPADASGSPSWSGGVDF